jgi:tyrosyl-tRNA synthetase
MELLVGTDGSKKMSKSLDNYVGITDQPVDMYGKVMSLPDNLIAPYYKLCTEIPLETIDELVKTLAAGANPRDSKASLAREIVRIHHGEAAALKAEESWNSTFRDKSGPTADQIADLVLPKPATVVAAIAKARQISATEARRLIAQGGVRVDGHKIAGDMPVKSGQQLQIGKHEFFNLK